MDAVAAEQKHTGSPPTRRVLAILEFLATHASAEASPSEIADTLGLSRSTGRSILQELEGWGYVTRSPSGRYALGAAPMALGRVAADRHPLVQIVSRILDSFPADRPLGYTVLARAGDELLAVARTGHQRTAGPWGEDVLRIPLVPPFGIAFASLSGPTDLARWLASANLDDADRERLLQNVRAIQRDGYLIEDTVEIDEPLLRALSEFRRDLPSRELAEQAVRLGELLRDVRQPTADSHASAILIPVPDTARTPALVIVVHVRHSGNERAQIDSMAGRLREHLTSASVALFG